MSQWTGAALTRLQDRTAFSLRWAFRFQPKTFAGVASPINLWTGVRAESLDLDGTARTYQPVGDSIEMEPVRYGVGTDVRYWSIGLDLTPDGETFARGLDTRIAPAQAWALIFNPETRNLLGFRRYWKGFIDGVTIGTGEQDGSSKITIRLASSARRGTLTRAGYKSDESQRLRDPTDRFRRYGDLGAVPNDIWGGSD